MNKIRKSIGIIGLRVDGEWSEEVDQIKEEYLIISKGGSMVRVG